jgi:hypothetical protein
MSSLDDFFASVECKDDTIEREPLTPEEIECTCHNLFKCSIEELQGDLFANLEKETGVGLFDFKSVITSSNTVNVDYLLLVRGRSSCHTAPCHKHKWRLLNVHIE